MVFAQLSNTNIIFYYSRTYLVTSIANALIYTINQPIFIISFSHFPMRFLFYVYSFILCSTYILLF